MNREMKDVTAVGSGLRGAMGCLGDAHCPLKCVAIAARWSVSFFFCMCVHKMFEEFYSGEHRLRQDITKTRGRLSFLFICMFKATFQQEFLLML